MQEQNVKEKSLHVRSLFMNANHNLIAAYTYFVSYALGRGTEEVFFFFISVC